ncbi:DcuS/MalK family sensor histidine kinase [Niallia sp. 03133]|uniref:DcuS/MalK family sensor histidine kinase n=1 Tax=Niallia sp. 03133 TaxID=3458060 RepID=UPI0040440116
MKRRWSLFTAIMTLVSIVVIFSLLITDIQVNRLISEDKKNSLAEKALTVARLSANSELVKNSLQYKEKDRNAVQQFTKDIQIQNDMLFVVVKDMKGIRLTHPHPDKIGKRSQSHNEKRAWNGHEEILIAEGTLGRSLRALAPVFDEKGTQIGIVSVGISLEQVNTVIQKERGRVLYSTILGLLAGVIGAYIVARYIKKRMFNLEPQEIAKLLQERSSMLDSVKEGIIAVDQNEKITLVNKSAIKYFKRVGLEANPVGYSVQDFMPTTRLHKVLKTGEAENDVEMKINGTVIVINRVPIIVKGKIVGALSTFRDKTDWKMLADQLSGVKTYAESLRAQSHEFQNRMQVIIGMLHMKCYEQLNDYVNKAVNQQNGEIEYITKNIKDPVLAGLLLGKLSYSREKGAIFSTHIENIIPELKEDYSFEAITIIGNLVDNAFDAVEKSAVKKIDLYFQYDNHNNFYIKIKDTGIGVKEEDTENIFKKGFSTKGKNRGYGLFLIMESLKKLNGEMEIVSRPGSGTAITASIPSKSASLLFDRKSGGLHDVELHE